MNNKLHVLLIDHDPVLLNKLIAIYEKEGHHVYPAQDPDEANYFLKHNPISLVVTDSMMPQMTGMDFARSLEGKWPVILLTDESTPNLNGQLEGWCHVFLDKGQINKINKASFKAIERFSELDESWIKQVS